MTTNNRRGPNKSCAASGPLRVTEFHGTEELEIPGTRDKSHPLVVVHAEVGLETRDLYWVWRGAVRLLRWAEGADDGGRIMWLVGAVWDEHLGEWVVWYAEHYEHW